MGPPRHRPRAPHDQRTKFAYIFGAICPAKGKGAGLVMPYCDSPAMPHMGAWVLTITRWYAWIDWRA